MYFEDAVKAKEIFQNDRSELEKMRSRVNANLEIVIVPNLTEDFLKFLEEYEKHPTSSDDLAKDLSSVGQYMVIALYWRDHKLFFELLSSPRLRI